MPVIHACMATVFSGQAWWRGEGVYVYVCVCVYVYVYVCMCVCVCVCMCMCVCGKTAVMRVLAYSLQLD